MNEVRGSYFDGMHSRGAPARLHWSAVAAVVLTDEGRRIEIDRATLKVPGPLPGTPTRVAFGEKESFVTEDAAGIEDMRMALDLSPGIAGRLEKRMPTVLAAAALVVALLAGIGIWGVPALAARLALTVPGDVSAQISAALMDQLDTVLEPSKIAPERQRELSRYFNSYGEIDTIEFRDAGIFGANAVALGMTMVAFSDDLVELVDSDEELLAVYFHELGHARLRHVEQNIFRSSAWLVLITVLTGDIGAVGELLVGLPLSVGISAYSRQFEREADAFAVDSLIEAGLSPIFLANILQKLESHHMDRRDARESTEAENNEPQSEENTENRSILVSLPDYLSTHPPTGERVAYVRSRMAEIE